MQSPTPYELRVNAGYHLVRTLAKAAGVSGDTLRKYERGLLQREREETYESFAKLAKVIGCTQAQYAVAVRGMADRMRGAK